MINSYSGNFCLKDPKYKTEFKKFQEDTKILQKCFYGILLVDTLIVGASTLFPTHPRYDSTNSKSQKMNYLEKNKVRYQQEKAKLDSVYQVKKDSLKKVFENKLERMTKKNKSPHFRGEK